MLIILSPAKTMNITAKGIKLETTQALFEKDADRLVEIMRQYTIAELEKLLKISKSLAVVNHKRYEQFNSLENIESASLLAYNGSVFKKIAPDTFSMDDFQYAQNHLRIISTLYGLLRPLDAIKAYRFAYIIKLKGLSVKNLYEYWYPKLTELLVEDVKRVGGVLVNLASLDILGALNMDILKKEIQIITPEFQEEKDGKYVTSRTYAKLARGAMTRYILLNRIEEQDKLKEFEWEGYRFNEKISNTERYIFTKKR